MKLGLLPDAFGGEPDHTPPRDIKKLVLIIGLGTLSWVATYIGMLELIQANMGDLPLIHKLIIGFSVAMLMTMIIWLLDQMFAPIGALTRLAYIAGYIFLSIISVGFGFGFYWKVLESRAESSRSAESAVTAVQSSLNAASTRLEQLNATLMQLAALSHEKAETERTKGTSCPNSKPGDGPRRKMRDEDAARFSFASEFVAGRAAAVKADMGALDGDLAKIAGADPSVIDPKTGTRNEFMKTLGRKLDMTVSSFNALRTDPQLKQLRADLSERADKTTFGDPKAGGGFVCPDAQLTQALRGAARAIAELPVLEKPTIAAVEGSEATIEAFRRLTTTFYGMLAFKLPPSADELRELQKKAMQSVEDGVPAAIDTESGGLSKRDYVPLAVAVFVDICLFLVSIGRPAHGLQGLVPKMRAAERGPVIEILSRFNDIHRDREIRESFELFRHVVFDVHGTYYVAVPLDSPPHVSAEQREELRTEAQLLANLFTSFEKDKIFKRTWTPFAGAVRKKLAMQGSKFADSEAFRIYKFRDGAWSEIILGAVMGAARRAEAEANRQRIERDLLNPAGPSLGRPTTYRATLSGISPYSDMSPYSGKTTFKDTAPPRKSTPRTAEPERSTKSRAPTDEQYRTGPQRAGSVTADVFGPYARSAEAELRTRPQPVDDQDIGAPANSNTAPNRKENLGPKAQQSPGSDPVSDKAAAPHQRVDFVLKRETATVTLPIGADDASGGLIGRLGQALTGQAFTGLDAETPVTPSPRLASNALIEDLHPAASDRRAHDEKNPDNSATYETAGADLDSDPATADAAAMAGRLRPVAVGD